MKPEQKKLLRDALVAALVTMAPLSLPLATLQGAAKAAGFSLSEADLLREMDYLVKSGMASVKTERLSAGVTRWEATAEAVNYAEAEGIA